MPMTAAEWDQVCTEIKGYFPTVAARMKRAPKLLALWQRTLQPFSTPLLLDALACAVTKNSRTLELDDMLASIQHLMTARQPARNVTIKSLLARAARRRRTPEDRLIAKLHCETVYHGLHRQNPTAQRQAAAQWRQWAQEYGAIQGHCLEQAQACGQRAQALAPESKAPEARPESVMMTV